MMNDILYFLWQIILINKKKIEKRGLNYFYIKWIFTIFLIFNTNKHFKKYMIYLDIYNLIL